MISGLIFTNGGHVQGKDFLLDLENDSVSDEKLKRMTVESTNLAKAGPIIIYKKKIVHRYEMEA